MQQICVKVTFAFAVDLDILLFLLSSFPLLKLSYQDFF